MIEYPNHRRRTGVETDDRKYIRRTDLSIYKRKNLLKAGDVCIVGVSGGADSICLLTVLAGLREKMELKLYAVHVNHMIRGTEADADESYVAEYCKKLGIPCDCYHIDVPQLAKKQKLTEEEAGRNARYGAFSQTADRCGLSDYKVAVAHNKMM